MMAERIIVEDESVVGDDTEAYVSRGVVGGLSRAWEGTQAAKEKAMAGAVAFYGEVVLVGTYVYTDSMRNKRNTLIGIFTVFLVLTFVCLLLNAISHSPVLFMKLAENQVGEFDLLLTPKAITTTSSTQADAQENSGAQATAEGVGDDFATEGEGEGGGGEALVDSSGDSAAEASAQASGKSLEETIGASFWLNNTEIQERLGEVESVIGVAPRWTFLGKLFHPENHNKSASVILLIIDSIKEEEIGLGRDWNRRPLGKYETYASSSALRHIGVEAQVGDHLHLGFDFIGLLTTFGLLDEEEISVLLKVAIKEAISNTTVTIPVNPDAILDLLGGLTDGEVPTSDPTSTGVYENVTLDLGNVSNDTIDALVDSFLEENWDAVLASLSPDQLYIDCTVVDGLDNPNGKWPSSLGNVAILEAKHLMPMLSDLLPNNPFVQDALAQALGIKDEDDDALFDLKAWITAIPIEEYALMSIINYSNRLTTYVKETKGMNQDMIQFTNQVAEALGISYPADFQLPIQQLLLGLNYLRIFLDQIFNSVMVILVGLGMMLIYSLLLSDVEDKTYEYGMLRALGLENNSLILLLTIQAVFFAVPGIILGLSVAYLGSLPFIYVITWYASVPPEFDLAWEVIILGVTVGLLMPIIANIFPIRRALSRTLRDSLDVYHQSSQEVSVRMVKLESIGLDPWQVAGSLMMVAIGFLIYYVVPMTFIFANISLFLTILNSILLGMLFGVSIVAAVFQPILERLLLRCLLWGKEKNLLSLVQKSLSGHRSRNRKTALMFTTCLAFIIFSGAMFTLQTRSIVDNVRAGIGADIVVLSALIRAPLDEENMYEFLEEQLELPPEEKVLQAYSFLTYPMFQVPDVRHNWVSNLADMPWHRLSLYGVDRDYLNVIFGDYYVVSEYDTDMDYQGITGFNEKPDIIRSLYDDAGNATLPMEEGTEIPANIMSSQAIGLDDGETGYFYRSNNDSYNLYLDAVVSEALRYGSYVDVNQPLKMELTATYLGKLSATITYLVKMRAMVTKMPGFFFSSYRQTAYGSPILTTMDTYQDLMYNVYDLRRLGLLRKGLTANETTELIGNFPKTPDKQRVLCRIKEGASLDDRETIMNGLRNYISDSLTLVLDTSYLLDTTDIATNVLLMFFNVVAIISSVLCFFVLWLSFTSNIKENSWEFGVLRAIGLSSGQVIRVYVYEAICIIGSALFLGCATGLIIAITLTLQFNLFTEMPFSFDFPYVLFSSVVVMAISVAIGGSYLAANDIKKLPIAQVLKGAL